MKTAFASTIRMMTAAMVVVPTLAAGAVVVDGLNATAFAQQTSAPNDFSSNTRGRDTDRDRDRDRDRETRNSPNYPCGTATTHYRPCAPKVVQEPCECRKITRNGLTFRDCYVTLTSGLVKYCNRPAKSLN